MTTKLILLSQPIHHSVAESELLTALPEAEALLPRREVAIGGRPEAEEAVRTGDWARVREVVETECREKLKPLLDGDGGLLVRYFGAAPVPLAIQLGSLVGSWPRVVAHLFHHDRKDWRWADPSAERPRVLRPSLPKPFSRGEGDVIVRVATSVPIDAQSTLEIVPTPVAEYEISLEPTGLDAVDRVDVLDEVADCFRAVLDDIAANIPNTRVVHVFASVPVGLAFRMGTALSPTMHPPVQTYFYDQKSEPKQRAAILLLANQEPTPEPLTAEDLSAATSLRTLWAEQAQQLGAFATLEEERGGNTGGSWAADVCPRAEARRALTGRWLELPHVYETVLLGSAVDGERREAGGAFDFQWAERRWAFDDRLLASIARRLVAPDLQARAGRMLLLHEGVHLETHKLTNRTSQEVGRFPKVLEHLDYQADVWAMIHEFAFSMQRGLTRAEDAVRFFLGLLDVALQTFWAFDDGPGPLRRMQVRRMNRYLIWYWQHLHIERATSLEQVVDVLSERPTLELAGPRLEARGERVFYDLDAHHVDRLEMAIVHRSGLHRYASGPATDLSAMLDGFRSRNGELVKDALGGIFSLVVR